MSQEKNRKYVLAGLLLGIFASSIDHTIVSTAMGTIVGELGGLDKITWVTAAYMAASVPSMLIFGRLSDIYGRKKFFLMALGMFLFGSVLCGLAQDMVQLTVFRAIQGLGGGAIMPISFTIIFDIMPPEERGKVSALFGAVFGLSSIFGPLLGAWFAQYLSWRYAFYINVPIVLVSLWLAVEYYKESFEHVAGKIDWVGTVLLITALSSCMLSIELGGKMIGWTSPSMILLVMVFLISCILLIKVESKSEEAVIAVDLFKNKLFAASQGASFFYGFSFIPVIVYVPIFAQAVYGGSASDAGAVLAPMMIASVMGSQISGRMATKTTYRSMMTWSLLLVLLGIVMLSTLTIETSRTSLTLYVATYGLGIGMSFSALTMSSIHGLQMCQRGSANSMVVFFRTIGMTLGITIFGSFQSIRFTKLLEQASPQLDNIHSINDVRGLLQPEVRMNFPVDLLQVLTGKLTDSIVEIFIGTIVVVLIAAIFVALMGQARLPLRHSGE